MLCFSKFTACIGTLMLFPYFDLRHRNNWTWFFHVHLWKCLVHLLSYKGRKISFAFLWYYEIESARDHFHLAMGNRFLFNIQESASVGIAKGLQKKSRQSSPWFKELYLVSLCLIPTSSETRTILTFFFLFFFYYILLSVQLLISVCPQLWFFYPF